MLMKRIIKTAVDYYKVLQNTWIGKKLQNKYILTGTVFFLWLLFFDQNSVLERRKFSNELKDLNEEKEYYLEKIEEDSKSLRELKTDNNNLEKFAREQYLMKKDNEDIFIIVDE